jgi:hypothetical protein
MVERSPRNKSTRLLTVSSRAATRDPVLGWQSPFATETGGLFKAGNSVASAEQTSAALKLHKLTQIIVRGKVKWSPQNKSTRLFTVSSRASACLTRDPVF